MLNTPKIVDTHIPIFTSQDQTVRGETLTLGMDTEMLFTAGKERLWPHVEGFPQERKPGAPFHWHGDAYAFELCVAPAYCLDIFGYRVGHAFDGITSQLRAKHPSSMTFKAPAVYIVPEEIQKSATDNVKRLGCAPSLNVYGDSGTPSKLGNTQRTTGCHLHVSAGPLLADESVARRLVKWADVLVGNVWNYISP